jgi:hypothetical protein
MSTTPTPTTARPRQPRQSGQSADGSREALRLAACVLEVLSGLRSPPEAAAALGVSVGRYYQLEQQAVQGLVRGCEPKPAGRVRSAATEVGRLRTENEKLKKECLRQQALVRLARQAAALREPSRPAPGGKKRRARKQSRGQQTATRLEQAAAAMTEPGDETPGG